MTAELDHAKLYINRSVTDEAGQTLSDAAAFCRTKDIIYLYGPAGCYQGLRNLSVYHKFGTFTVTTEDAKEYLYSFSTRRRVYKVRTSRQISISKIESRLP
jgi:hypothetical protein